MHPHVTPLRASDPRRVGRYQLAGRIAGMPASGPVYLAHSADGSDVTVTLPGGDWAAGSAARDRFAAEAAAAMRVAPFCAARILDAGIDEGGQAFLVSEHVAGPSLLEFISAAGELSGDELTALAIGAATGLAAIHQAGLVHGDFRPEYLMISAAGPQVIGFSISPPRGAATPAADMLAWAQAMVIAAGGSPPASPGDLKVLPQPLRRIAAACMSPRPAARPTARSVVRELLGDDDPAAGTLAEGSRRSAGGLASSALAPSAAPPASRPQRPQRPRPGRRRRVMAILWTACVLAVVLAAAAVIHRGRDADGRAGAIRPEADGGTESSPAARSATPSASAPSPSPSAPPAARPALAGSWSGQATQANVPNPFSVQVALSAGARSGTISYSGTISSLGTTFTCSGDLSLVSSAAGARTMDQTIVTDQALCANGLVTLRQKASGALMFRFRGQDGEDARGTLARQ